MQKRTIDYADKLLPDFTVNQDTTGKITLLYDDNSELIETGYVETSSNNTIKWNKRFLLQYPILNFLKESFIQSAISSKEDLNLAYSSKAIVKLEINQDILTVKEAVNLYQMQAGSTYFLDNLTKNSAVTMCLRTIFKDDDLYLKIQSLAYFIYLEKSCDFNRYGAFAFNTRLPYQKVLDTDEIFSIFSDISKSKITAFFKLLNIAYRQVKYKRPSIYGHENIILALDSFTQSLNKATIDNYMYGLSQLDSNNLLCFVSLDYACPFAYEIFDGITHVPDIDNIAYTIGKYNLKNANSNFVDSPIFVCDLTAHTSISMQRLINNSMRFIVKVKNSLNVVKNLIDNNISIITATRNYNKALKLYCSCFDLTTFKETKISSEFDAQSNVKNIYVYVYYDANMNLKNHEMFSRRIENLINKYQLNIPMSKEDKLFFNYFIELKDSSCVLKFDVAEKFLNSMSTTVLFSNCKIAPDIVRRYYNERVVLDNSISQFKQSFLELYDKIPLDAHEGFIFTTYVAYAMGFMLRRCMRDSTVFKDFNNNDDHALVTKLSKIKATLYHGYHIFSDIDKEQEQIFREFDMELPKVLALEERNIANIKSYIGDNQFVNKHLIKPNGQSDDYALESLE